MSNQDKLPTAFAPAERAAKEEIYCQSQHFIDIPVVETLFDTIPDVLVVLNEHRQIVFANQTLLAAADQAEPEAIYGLRPGEVLDCVHASKTEGGCGTTEFCATCGAVQAIMQGLQGENTTQECRITQSSGEALDLRVWATPFDVEEEQFIAFAVKDISHEKRRRALERIFFHDLMNAVGGLHGFAELLKESEPGEFGSISDKITALSRRLLEEINTQRELAAAENGELKVCPVPIDSRAFLYELIFLYQNHEVTKGRKLEIAPNARPIQFTSDEILLRRVIGNMVKNALEASQPGEKVTLGCEICEPGIKFWVHNPAFMPRHVQLQIFQRSFSTKSGDRGLGTYSMKLLSEQYLQGEVSFTTSPEKGTTFWGCYPLDLETA